MSNAIKIYAVHDSVAGAFATPYFAVNDGVAVRSFGRLVMDQNHPYHHSPADFTLYCVGSFDVQGGNITADELRSLRNGLGLQTELLAIENMDEVHHA